MRIYVPVFFLFLTAFTLNGQSSGELQKQLQKLNSFTRVMYIAAHPDDENTRVIAWLSQGRNAEVRYLSLTRGDGGQNMIGTELGPELGILRTQELLAARRIDGGTQVFSRAVDFGYSKSATETMQKWNKRQVLGDVVRAIRAFQPDIVITRFPPDSRGGHGHHTASAVLAMEAFDIAGSDTAFADQLGTLSPWQPSAVYWNTYSWRWDPNLDSLATHDPDYLKADIGGYDPWLGVSYNELGSLARSQHRCQGFGVSIQRGTTDEYFYRLKGRQLNGDILQGVDRSWASAGGTERMMQMAEAVQSEFDPSHPEKSLPLLLQLRDEVATEMEDDFWRAEKLVQLDELIAGCAGIYAEANSPEFAHNPNELVEVKARIIARGVEGVQVTQVNWGEGERSGALYFKTGQNLPVNEFVEFDLNVQMPESVSQPYWLKHPFDAAYVVDTDSLIGRPENPSVAKVVLRLEYQNMTFFLRVPVDYKWSDRVDGEQRRPVVAAPKVTATFEDNVFIFSDDTPSEVRVRLRSFAANHSTQVDLSVPEGWSVSPKNVPVDFAQRGEEKVLTFTVTPSEGQSVGTIRPVLAYSRGEALSYSEIAYSHIPTQSVFRESSAKVVKIDLTVDPVSIGYVQGAGDEVDVAIAQMGFDVHNLSESDFASGDLSDYASIVIGIRAYNVISWLPNYRDQLMKYVENGGNVIVQYNTASRDLMTTELGPYPFELGRDRVTEEDAKATIIDPAHPFFNIPNKITAADFDGWVQERGLYFASDWDSHYQPLISWHDTDEPARIGGLLFTPYGKGSFSYVGISFFRQLPAGVPGAYRLLANILSYEHE